MNNRDIKELDERVGRIGNDLSLLMESHGADYIIGFLSEYGWFQTLIDSIVGKALERVFGLPDKTDSLSQDINILTCEIQALRSSIDTVSKSNNAVIESNNVTAEAVNKLSASVDRFAKRIPTDATDIESPNP